MPAYPAPNPPPIAHFSAADFFRDCPWLKVPSYRKADILIEPLYPQLGLLGGAPDSGGKVSKLAALAAARKKKESGSSSSVETPLGSEAPMVEQKGTPLSLRERLAAANAKSPKPSEGLGGLRRLGKSGSSTSSTSPPAQKQTSPKPVEMVSAPATETSVQSNNEPTNEPEPKTPASDLRASPSMFASAIVGNAARRSLAEPSHLHSNTVDLLRIYGQDPAEHFDFAAPSPDDVVLYAQNTAKGLAIRRKV